MLETTFNKLCTLQERYAEIDRQLCDPEVINDHKLCGQLARERMALEPVVERFKRYRDLNHDIEQARELLENQQDLELCQLAEEELTTGQLRQEGLERELSKLLLNSKSEDDERDIFLELRAGTGGDEAALFASDLLRMYLRFAEERSWTCELINSNSAELGGYKLAVVSISGRDVYRQLKFESGTHRVQRVPETESQGRIHTSACTVAVLPLAKQIDSLEIDRSELRVDTFRASGAGGQHVNKTDSAVRLTHLPTGIVVECQNDRSQHKNRANAMTMLRAKLLENQRESQVAEQAKTRREMVGSGDRSGRIRTYNFPQGRVTDHRIQCTLHRLDEVLSGRLDLLIEPLIEAEQAEKMGESFSAAKE